ncbi:MAG: C39 family peptidase [Chloroflexi bacterium]|nr:C39 family peptidase [Chloroflexota bacterium]
MMKKPFFNLPGLFAAIFIFALISATTSVPAYARSGDSEVSAELIESVTVAAAEHLQVDRNRISIESIRVEDVWAAGNVVVSAVQRSPKTTLAFAAQYIDPEWIVLLDLEEDYNRTLDQLPDSFREDGDANTVSSKVLGVPYIDQAYQQKKIQTADRRWHSREWYMSGPVSLNMVMSYFGCARTYVSTTKAIAKIIFENPFSDEGRYIHWSRIPPNLETRCEIESALRRDAANELTYEEIQGRIDASLPILTALRIRNSQHVVVIIGYIEPDIVIIHDPFGGTIVPYHGLWSVANLPVATSQKTTGRRIEYTFGELKELYSGKWLDIYSTPSGAPLSQ